MDIENIIRKAEQGDSDAQYQLGCRYMIGDGVEKNYDKSFEYLLKPAEQGLAEAQARIGFCYFHGFGTEKTTQQLLNGSIKPHDKETTWGNITWEFVILMAMV